MNIIAVDWGKDTRKRAAYISRLASRTITRLTFDGSLGHLVAHASTLEGPALIGIDAAIGYPSSAWAQLQDNSAPRPRTFAEFLLDHPVPDDFFEPISEPRAWSAQRPFVRPPPGRFSLNAFIEASAGGFHRKIDRALNANPIFLTSGIPGSVGSGTKALWQELIGLSQASTFNVWPFHGALDDLLRQSETILAEIYPKACYGIALSEALPAPLTPISKTKSEARIKAIEDLRQTRWLARHHVDIKDLDAARHNEDDFDALISVAALTRLFLEKAPFESPETTDSVAEGGVLGAASLTSKTSVKTGKSPKKTGL